MPRTLYTLLLYLGMPLVLLRLLWRARRQRGYLRHVGERFGFYDGPHAVKPCIWVHAVSVGETRAAEPLIRALRARHPQHRILLTHMTPTGRETGVTLFGDEVERTYLPYDLPGAMTRFMARFRPAAGVLMETEIWPNLVHAAVAAGVPVYLVNARLSARSFAGYRRTGALARNALRGLAAIAAQSGADAERLRALGATSVTVAGNLKFDQEISATQVAQGRQWRAGMTARPVILAASTREGEETLLLDAVLRAGAADVLWVIVPRHPQRFDDVAALIGARGLQLQRRSSGGPVAADSKVLLGDSLGEMAAYYAFSDVVLMGGSFLDFGAHNLIEPCATGKPVIIGPSTYNFAQAAQAAVAAGAALQTGGADQAVAMAVELAQDGERCRRMGAAGIAFAAAHRGATLRVLDLLRITAD
ncbi:MAG: lipid IV(A) 3-deoxy-D-manno-octulosonic acid transferase [Burkholderiales bacterium]